MQSQSISTRSNALPLYHHALGATSPDAQRGTPGFAIDPHAQFCPPCSAGANAMRI